jgi:hypothetical protein
MMLPSMVKPLPLIAWGAILWLSFAATTQGQTAKGYQAGTMVEAAQYIPCGDSCSALADAASAFCFRVGDQFLVGDGESYLHEGKFSGMEELAGSQFQVRFNRRSLWIKQPDGSVKKLRRGSQYENFKDAGCVREVHRPIVAAANAHRRPAGVPADAMALAGSGRGELPTLFLWYECGLDSDKATIACRRWYRNGDADSHDWYCARTMDGAAIGAEFALDPLLSQSGRLVLTSGAVLQKDHRGRTNGQLDRLGEACW